MYYDPGWGSLQTALLLWPKRLPQDCHPKVNRHQNILRYLTTMLLQHPLRHAPVGDDEREHPQDCRGKSKSGQEKCRILSSVGQKNCKSTLIVALNILAWPALKRWIKISKTERICFLKNAAWILIVSLYGTTDKKCHPTSIEASCSYVTFLRASWHLK